MKQHHKPQESETLHLTTGNCTTVRGDTPLVNTDNIYQNDDSRKDRPNGGLYVDETDTSLTLQTGQWKSRTVIAYENHPNDSRITETGDISQQLTSRMGTGGGNVPLVQVLNDQGGAQIHITDDITGTLRAHEHGHQPIVMAHGQGNAEISCERSPALTCNHEAPILNGVRRLTPTECERLQGFPDGWTEGQADSHRYKQLGNAVCVNVAEWIGKRIVERERRNKPN